MVRPPVKGLPRHDPAGGGRGGIVFALVSYMIAIGVVVILGAVTGIVWQERGLSFQAAFRELRRSR
jgi:membrane protein